MVVLVCDSEYVYASKICALSGKVDYALSFFKFKQLTHNELRLQDPAKNDSETYNLNKQLEWAKLAEIDLLKEMILKFEQCLAGYSKYTYDSEQKHRELLQLLDNKYIQLFEQYSDDMDIARHKAQIKNGSNAWLNVIPNSAYGVKFSNNRNVGDIEFIFWVNFKK